MHIRKRVKGLNPLTLTFENWTEYITHADTVDRPHGNCSRIPDGRTGWAGTRDWPEALSIMVKGWVEGTHKARAISEPIERNLYNVIELPFISYDVTGELLDVARYSAGEPEHWGNWHRELREGQGNKHVHIVVNGSASSGVKTDVIIARGATIAALVNLLEMAGHRAKVSLAYGLGASRDKKSDLEIYVPLKQYDDVLDIDRLTCALAHPSTFRRITFSVMEGITDSAVAQELSIGSRYGIPTPVQDTGDLYFDRMLYGEDTWTDPDKATKWVSDKLIEYGVIKPVAA